MTQQQRNNQIAMMLGWKEEQEGTWFKVIDSANYVIYSQHNNYPHKGLPFHRDWNYLMEAVEFIEKNHAWVKIKGCSVDITKEFSFLGETKKIAVFIAVSDFAKQINDKK
jgi:hypothetical protein